MNFAKDIGCVNPDCSELGNKGGENIIVRKLVGKDAIRYVRCRTCRQEFSERRRSALFGFRLPQEKVVDVVAHLAEGVGIRKTARLTAVSRHTVGRINRLAGSHAKALHDELVQGLDVREAQMDEMWSFVKKKTRRSNSRDRAARRKEVSGTT